MLASPERQSETLPALIELQSKKQWVCWCYEPAKNGKMTKVPYQARNGYKASTTNPKNWGTYEDAVKAQEFARNVDGKPFDGIGFVFNDDYTGIDWDHCINEDSTIEPWAQELIDRLDTYCEFSPSKTGIHGIARALLPEVTKTKGEVTRPGKKVGLPGKNHPQAAEEIYCQGRFFTMTENHLPGTPTTIEDRQEKVTALYQELLQINEKPAPQQKQTRKASTQSIDLSDHELIEKACTASNGAKFSALWYGDSSAYGSDDSAADQALCNLLAFWADKDTARMDRLFRQSGLYRAEKWDRNARSGETYGEGTIREAVANCREVYKKQKSWTTYSHGQEYSSNENGNKEASTELPSVILGGQLRDNRDDSLRHLGKSEEQEPTIFVQSGRLVQIGRDKDNKTIIMTMGVPEIKNALTKSSDFFTLRKVPHTENEYVPKPASPPKEIAEAILALSPSKWPFKPLEGIVETPVIRPDGTVLQRPGYDELTKLYYAPHEEMQACNVPESPTKKEAREALAVLQDIIAEFPYVDEPDFANLLALMLTPIIRPAIKRHVPLALIDAPKQGAGKGLLSDIVAIIATGDSAPIMPAPKNDEEWDKKITSILMTGATIITLDNLPSRLQSSMLDAVLTADYWVGRILGVSKMVKVPHRATWVATGNNIKVGGDLARRCYRIRIDPQISKPWNRAGFKYEDLATHVKEHRAEIITAILTLVRAWFIAGCHIDKTIPALGTFTGWARMVGSILKFAGVNGFLGNLDKLYDEMDEENAQWALFLQAWKDTFGDRAVFVKELVDALAKEEEGPKQDKFFDDSTGGGTGGAEKSTGGSLADFLPDYLQDALQSPTKEKQKVQKSFSVTLGKQLEKRVDTCFGEKNLKLHKERDKAANTTKWSVITGGAGGGFSPSTREEPNEEPDEESCEREKDAQYEDGLNNLRHLRYEDGNTNGENGTNQGEKTTEPLNSTSQDGLFSGTPPVNSNTPPVNLDALPALARRLYVELVGSAFNERPSTIYRGEYLPLSDFYNRLTADLASTNEAISQTALAILQKKLAEVAS
jgi:cation transport regulator ChaC